jgi:hypothetical protein
LQWSKVIITAIPGPFNTTTSKCSDRASGEGEPIPPAGADHQPEAMGNILIWKAFVVVSSKQQAWNTVPTLPIRSITLTVKA